MQKRQYLAQSILFLSFILFSGFISAQNNQISGKILNANGQPIEFATIAIKTLKDSTIVKVEMTDEKGVFAIQNIAATDYLLEATYLGLQDFRKVIQVEAGQNNLGELTMEAANQVIEEVTVTAQRSLIEAKSDRMVFNVQGTINSSGENLLNLLRKAPGVLVDNNNNISVLSRSGVLIYVDGKRLPLSGDDLSAYLQGIPSEQIDKIDIITNPGAKYEAQGNAGIIDIIMKRDKSQGTNGSISSSIGQGRYTTGNVNTTGNYRNKSLNVFATAGYNGGTNWNNIIFSNDQNGFLIDEDDNFYNGYNGVNLRLGTDFFISKKSTLGFLITGQNNINDSSSKNRSEISRKGNAQIDSILRADNTSASTRNQRAYNLNYAYRNGETTINADLDYGSYINDSDNYQPNQYYNNTESIKLSSYNNHYLTPVSIDISTVKVDVEMPLMKGKFGFGSKYSEVSTDNQFLFYNVINNADVRNDRRSNRFKYLEKVGAAYANYNRPLSSIINFSAGLRLEHTNSKGDLQAFLPELQAPPVKFNYLSYFPSAGITYQKNPAHVIGLNYGRRINRPDYNVLNPFREQITELSYSRGNAFLRPEIVNNIELSYTMKYRYNFTLAYSNTSNQITRLIGADEEDARASYISYDNLATQKILSLNASLPIDIAKWWNSYWNLAGSHTENKAENIDIKVYSFNLYQQQTFTLPKKWKLEVSGWFSGPGVWGGVFLYDSQYSLNFGAQRRFINDKLNVRLAFNDVTYQSGWSGTSNYNGLIGTGTGNRDSRRATLSLSYDLGNQNVKSRKRETGLENEAKRVGS